MIQSMTGYGKSKAKDKGIELEIEIKTVNHRYLDINFRLPKALSFLEDEARKKLQESISRGRVDIYVSYKNSSQDQLEISINESVAKGYINSLRILSDKFHINGELDINTIAALEDIFTISEVEEDYETLKTLFMTALDEALNTLKQMRQNEGMYLVEDIMKHTDLIEELINYINDGASIVVDEYREKLEQRLKELLSDTELDETRFNQEVAYLADRSNITEEIIRLRSHLNQLRQTILDGGIIGRKLDFIVQEMNREINTIGSKSSSISITAYVVEIKSEIEKIREQIQNLE